MALTKEHLLKVYRDMVLIRKFEEAHTSGPDLKIGQTASEIVQAPNPKLEAQLADGVDSVVMASMADTIVGRVAINLVRSIGERLSPRVKAYILCFIMIAFIVSCTSSAPTVTAVEIGTATSVVAEPRAPTMEDPTLPAMATTAPTMEVPTLPAIATTAPTEKPTSIPTEAGPNSADYQATSENKFPLKEAEGMAQFYLTIDFSNVLYSHQSTPDGTVQNAWFVGKDGKGTGEFTFLIPAHYENEAIMYLPIAMGSFLKNERDKIIMPDDPLKQHIEKLIIASGFTNQPARARLLVGLNTGNTLRFGDPFPEIFAATQWDESIKKFMLSGNPADLPTITINGVTGKLLPGLALKNEIILYEQ